MSDKTEEMKAPSLSEFVSAAILDIAAGLNDAQDKGRELGVKIYPNSYEDTSKQMDIEFDLSVSSETEGKTDGGVKINIPVLGVSYGKDSTGKTGTANRIRFTVPVNYVVMNKGQRKYTEQDLENMPRMGM